MLYDKLANLQLTITDYALEPQQQRTSAFVRHTTIVRLRGNGLDGVGEDITYSPANQSHFQAMGPTLPLAGTYTLEEFSQRLDAFDLFPDGADDNSARLHRRWAFESAALDLALRQSSTSLATALGREPAPVHYAVSLGLGDPPDTSTLEKIIELYPDTRFKVDLAENWTEETVDQLAALGRAAVIDLKGHYRGAFSGPAANSTQYRWIAEKLPDAWIEDPWLGEPAGQALQGHLDRVTWDAVLHSLSDVIQLEHQPRCINIKPSRFGLVSELMRVYDYCENRGIAMYGGGQFELGPGRGQIQYLASLFHAEAANDVAPSAFNDADLRTDLEDSPLAPSLPESGFRWGPAPH